MMSRALLVIDMQQGIMDDKTYVLECQDELFNIVNQAIDLARKNLIPICFVQHSEKEGLVEFSAAWQLDSRLHKEGEDYVFSKWHSDAFWDTSLLSYLTQHNIQQLIICGVQTEYCIDTTLRSAHRLGYQPILISNGHSTINNESLSAHQIIDHHNRTLSSFAQVLSLNQINFD